MQTQRSSTVLDRPVVLLGPGRAGSTLVQQILTLHPDLAYFTNWTNRFPRLPALAALTRLRAPRIERAGRQVRGLPLPAEAYGIWKHAYRDFWATAEHGRPDAAGDAAILRTIVTHLRTQGRSRMFVKVTGPPVFEFFERLFGDPRLIWLDRDPRAVVHSYFKRNWVGIPAAEALGLPESERLRLACQRYLAYYDAARRASAKHLWLRYEDLTADPIAFFARLLEHAELSRDPGFMETVERWPVARDSNLAWQRRLTEEQRVLLDDLLRRPIEECGYR